MNLLESGRNGYFVDLYCKIYRDGLLYLHNLYCFVLLKMMSIKKSANKYKKPFFIFLSFCFLGCHQKWEAQPSNERFVHASESCESYRVQGEYLVSWKSGKVSLERYGTEKFFVKSLEDRKDKILFSEPHYRLDAASDSSDADAPLLDWGRQRVEANFFSEEDLPKKEMIVAVVDSGLDMDHPELQGVVAINEKEIINGKDDDGNGLIDDRYGFDFANQTHEISDTSGHGTHIAGVIAARHDVGMVRGVAPHVKILPLNFMDQDTSGFVRSAVLAIRYASDRGAKIINASWADPVACSRILEAEIARLAEKNILFVTAAGNEGNNLDQKLEFPASFNLDNMIVVGASTSENQIAPFSNYGSSVDIVAPGTNIISTYPWELDTDGSQDGVHSFSGTSVAAPFVSGAAALLWAKKPDASYLEIKEALLQGVTPGPYPVISKGQLNVHLALEFLDSPSQEAQNPEELQSLSGNLGN